ncbi:hypothetical protein CYY_003590 [Polysphondylium violaceum]|uniref:Uncharacterized protein n=1 Tax=Polysphondylium violaceum TaxID=133409 RepID=A0A8J4PW45_9MYCE|nr:hypothetical protein CYY_003590 [Polysphondylium violaceum]
MEFSSNSLPSTPVLTSRNNSYTNLRRSLDSSTTTKSNSNSNSNSTHSNNTAMSTQTLSGNTHVQSNISIPPPTSIPTATSNTTTTSTPTTPVVTSNNSYLDSIRKGGFNIDYHVDESDYHNRNQSILTTTSNTTIINDGASMVMVENSNLLNFDNLADDTFSDDGLESMNPKLISSLAYFTWLSASIILILEKKNVFIQFHAYQSFIISMCAICLQFLFIWTKTVSIIIWSVYLLFVLFMIFKVNYDGGKAHVYKLPVIGEIAEKRAIQRSREYSIFSKYVESSFSNNSNGGDGGEGGMGYSSSSINTSSNMSISGSSVSTSTKSTPPLSDIHQGTGLNSSYDDISIIAN